MRLAKLKGFTFVVAIITLAGCNSIYFYETDKISITLEGRPDPSAPISGSLGIKQRVVAVVPPKTVKNDSPSGDCLALLYSFYFEKEDTTGSPITIRTALLSGAAAKVGSNGHGGPAMSNDAIDKAAKAVAGTPRFVTETQADLQGLFDRAFTLPQNKQDEVFANAAAIAGGDFLASYTQKVQAGVASRVAFAATKNTYLGDELAHGDGPRHRAIIEAMRTALSQ